MSLTQKIFFFLIFGGYFLLFSQNSYGFLGEDLGLDIYKNIDEGVYDLELKQYEYELTGQGETDVSEVVGSILESEGLECDIETIQQMEDIISGPNPIGIIQLRCNNGEETLPSEIVARVSSQLSNIKSTYSQRAEDKAREIYEIAKIGIYSDGNEENSPFDLMVDLQEIDRVIFSEEIEYHGEKFDIGDEELIDFLTEDKSYLYEEETPEEESPEDEIPEEEIPEEEAPEEESPEDEIPEEEAPEDHVYACFPPDESGLNPEELEELDNDIDIYVFEDESGGSDIPVIEDDYYVYTDDEYTNNASWGGPFRGAGPYGSYSAINDSWNCDTFFCIVIEFSMKNYNLLGGGQTTSIESILTKAAQHLEKFANTSLVQSKMTTNNFELGLVIPDLGEMLRGFGIQVQTRPAPILNNVEQSPENQERIDGDLYTGENLLHEYYRNSGLDYERRNDLDIINQRIYERQVFEEAGGLSITYAPARLQELERFTNEIRQNNETVSQAVDVQASYQELDGFYDQFVELETFVRTINDFVSSMSGMIRQMKEIPTRTS